MKITKIEKVKYDGNVYNFHCTPNENYMSENVLVHNCYKSNTKNGTNMSYQTFTKIFDNMSIDCFEVILESGEKIYVSDLELLNEIKK